MEPVLCILGNISFLAKMADFFDQLNAKIVSRCSRNKIVPIVCVGWKQMTRRDMEFCQ